MFDHYTLDLETMGNGPTSAIIAIGAVAFDPYDEGVATVSQFYRSVTLDSSLKAGLTVDASTIQWWMEQEQSARLAPFVAPVDLTRALDDLNAWVYEVCRHAVCWTHATFDAPILSYACRAVGVPMPTHFRKQRDIRTLSHFHLRLGDGGLPEITREGTHHDALADAMYQSRYISTMYRTVMGEECE